MIPPKPSILIQSSTNSTCVQAARRERLPTSSFSHISSFRSLLLEIQLYSPSVKVVKQPAPLTSQPRPVFWDQDKIEGKVVLDPSCSHTGRLTITLEGVFEYSAIEDDADNCYHRHPTVRKHRHVLLYSSAIIPLSHVSDSRSAICEALGVRKRPSMSSLNSSVCRSCEFGFELPRGSRPGEEMPPTFSSMTPSEHLEVAYRIMAVWEASDGSENRTILAAPVLFQPDSDFQSVDGSAMEPKSWLEMPLMSERPIPFNCAVTLPRPQSFSRCGSIPYFVVFATSTRSACLIKEIAADATTVVSLIRKITLSPRCAPYSPLLPDTSSAIDESNSQPLPFAPHIRLLKRSFRTPWGESFSANPSELPREVFSVSQTLRTQVSIGFPKRPRTNNMTQNLPEGLYKGKIKLSKDMISSVDWPGISVKYYLDVSVLVGQDVVRARIPIRVY